MRGFESVDSRFGGLLIMMKGACQVMKQDVLCRSPHKRWPTVVVVENKKIMFSAQNDNTFNSIKCELKHKYNCSSEGEFLSFLKVYCKNYKYPMIAQIIRG